MDRISLRVRLMAALVALVAVPMLVAGWFGISTYQDSLYAEGQRAVETNSRIAHQTLRELQQRRLREALDAADDPRIVQATTAGELRRVLADRAEQLDVTCVAVVGADGVVRASSTGGAHPCAWPLGSDLAGSGEGTVVVAVVPDDELSRLGLAGSLALNAKQTPMGTVVEGESAGALGVVAFAPVAGGGSVVVFDSLKLKYGLVDAIVDTLGGNATIFQHGVRVSTTVLDDRGNRAIGTVVSDPVRERTLGAGEPFRGEAVVVGKDHLTAYDPLRDPSGDVVGMLYVGLALEPYQQAITRFAISFTVLLAVGLGLAIGVSFLITRGMTRPLDLVVESAGSAAGGDLTVTVPVTGYREARSVGEAFNAMIGGLRQLIGQTSHTAGQLSGVSTDITTAARAASDSASRQASSVAQITATVSELSKTFASVADSAQRVLAVAEDSLESAQSGRESVEDGDRTVQELAGGASEVAEAASAMGELAQDITEMTSIIQGIAEQTKILALNAAIEAARAGEAGRGFSVVATEIRGLAESVQQSAGRINGLVGGIQDASAHLTGTAGQQAVLAERSVAKSATSRDAFDTIVDQMEGTARAAREIASAAAEQRTAAEQLAAVMQDVTSSADETAQVSKDLVASADVVRNEAEELRQGLSGFRT